MSISQNNLYKQHHTGFPAKACNLLKIFSYLSKVSIYVN